MFEPLDRRTFLKASGVAMALPLLETMSPAITSAAVESQEPPKRMVIVSTALGLYASSLFPETPGKDYESTEYLDLLKEHRNDYTLFSGLSHNDQTGREPHSCELTFLTAARGPALGGFRNSVSIDQFAAEKLGYTTRFPSVVMGSKSVVSQSYSSSGVMVPAENRPSRQFTRMFLQGTPRELERQERKLQDGRSILDSLMEQTKSLNKRASAFDKEQLDEYYESVRRAEMNITEVQAWSEKPKPVVDEPVPEDIKESTDLIGRVDLMLDLIPLILQTDSSRVVVVKIQDNQNVPDIEGVSGQHHNLSHHGLDPANIAQLRRIESGLVGSFAKLLTQLKQKKEAGGNLLDNSTTLLGSNLGNANAHSPRNLPIILAGGEFNHGNYVAHDHDNNAPLCNLYLTMLNNMGIETDSFAQSTGTMTW